jgi:hypothetical protein
MPPRHHCLWHRVLDGRAGLRGHSPGGAAVAGGNMQLPKTQVIHPDDAEGPSFHKEILEACDLIGKAIAQ